MRIQLPSPFHRSVVVVRSCHAPGIGQAVNLMGPLDRIFTGLGVAAASSILDALDSTRNGRSGSEGLIP